MILPVKKLGDEILRQKSVPIEEVTDELRKLAEDMFDTMIALDGVGLACPQIGKNIRMFVLIADDDVRRVFINPQIIKTSEEIGDYDEGCLSLPKIYETIKRPVRVTVQALNEKGRPFTLDADGLLARIIQHEYDHLEGLLFIDRGDPAFAEKARIKMERLAQKEAKKRNKKRK